MHIAWYSIETLCLYLDILYVRFVGKRKSNCISSVSDRQLIQLHSMFKKLVTNLVRYHRERFLFFYEDKMFMIFHMIYTTIQFRFLEQGRLLPLGNNTRRTSFWSILLIFKLS